MAGPRPAESERGAIVEIVEYLPFEAVVADLPCIKPNAVRVNGQDVGLIKTDSIQVEVNGDTGATEVTLTLLPTSVLLATWSLPKAG